MRVLVASRKGGSGKTTTAVHLAAALHERAATALVDLDANSSSTDWAAAGRLPFPVLTLAEARGALAAYQHVVVDTSARPDEDELRQLAARVGIVLVPTMPDALSVRGLVRTIKELRDAGTPYRVALVSVPPRPSREGPLARAALERAGVPLFRAEVPRRAAFHEAALRGVLAHEVRRGLVGWVAYEELTREVLHEGT